MNTTPVHLTTGDCVYHIAKHVLRTHGLKSAEVAQALDVAECKVNAPSGTQNTNGES